MTWIELIEAFSRSFGPESPTPVIVDHQRICKIDDQNRVRGFLADCLLNPETKRRFAEAHLDASLTFTQLDVFLNVCLMQTHPLWDAALGFNKDRRSARILRLKRKRFAPDKWSCVLDREGSAKELDAEIDLLSSLCIYDLENTIKRDYEKVRVLDAALKILQQDSFIAIMDAHGVVDVGRYNSLQLCYRGNAERNITFPHVRKRLLEKLKAYEGTAEAKPEMPLDEIALRGYIANVGILKNGLTCPQELVDETLKWILNDKNDLRERLNNIILEAVAYATDHKNLCPYCESGECALSPDDNECDGTRSEQAECAYR